MALYTEFEEKSLVYTSPTPELRLVELGAAGRALCLLFGGDNGDAGGNAVS